jgi:hypothetical protein
MKRFFAPALFLTAAVLLLFSCDLSGNDGGGEVPELYKGFYNYPDGRKDANGLLTIKNSAASKVLLFTGSVEAANYIGTVEGLSSVKVKLPEEKFYTIVAVDQTNYEDKQAQAYQFSNLTYYSNLQPYSMSVSPSELFGAGKWILANRTSYWVALQKVDGSGDNWAVLAPNTLRAEIPIQIGRSFDYVPHFYKELKYQGKVIALVEYDDVRQADTVTTTTEVPTFNTSIGKDISLPNANLKPAVLLTNHSDKTVRVFVGQNNQLSPDGTDGDFSIASGSSAMITSGIEAGVTHTTSINFYSPSWDVNEFVKDDITMRKNMVYQITLRGSQRDRYTTSVEEIPAEEYFAE